MARKRRALARKQSKKVFRRGTRVHPKNAGTVVMRGGIRL